jgi:glutathione S-transferase
VTDTPTLVSLRYSPWSERARWALDHHAIAYRLVLHEPFIGEPKLRKLAGPRVGPATVPLLVTADERLMDSFEIARWADAHGAAAPLIPPDRAREIAALNAQVSEAMDCGRAIVTAGVLADGAALEEALPRGTPRFARRLLRPFARFGTRWFARKYALELTNLDEPRRVVARMLQDFRERYAERPYLLERFSYADILFCALLQGVSPVADRYIRLGPAWRRAWTEPALAEQFADLVARRDRLYAEHRPARVRPPA